MNIIEEIRAFREIVLGKQDKLVPGDHIILGDDDVISVDFGPVDALLDRLEEVEDDVNTLNFDVTELDIRLDAAEENIDDAHDHLDSIDDSIDVLSSNLEALGQKVDNIHGFEIIALSEGQYDPITMKPTIQNPKTNTLYLVPNYDPTQRNLWIEWLWLGGRWEQFGTAVIDLSEYVMKTDLPTTTTTGVVKVNRLNGIQLLTNGQLAITPASIGDISSGQSETLPITPYQQHNAVFYGLARAARTPALYYSAPDKTNIRLMLDAGSHAQVEELAEQVEGYGISVAQLLNTDKTTPAGMVWESKEYGAGWSEAAQGKVVDVLKDGESLMDEHGIVELPDVDVPTKTSDLVNDSGFITESSLPTKVSDLENDSGFLVSADLANYALISDLPTKVSDLQNDSGFLTEVPVASSITVGGIKLSSTYKIWKDSDDIIYAQITNYEDYGNASTKAFISKGTLENVLNGRGYPVDIRIDGATIIDENKVANIPLATLGQPGLIITNNVNGLTFNGQYLSVMRPFDSEYKAGAITHKSINPAMQHYSTFYGLAKAAGHDEKDSTLAFGTYTDEAKTAIKNMLGITPGEKEIFEAIYDVTSYDEIAEAVEDGKIVLMNYNDHIYSLSVLSDTMATFNSLDSAKMRWAYTKTGETVVWRSGTDNLQTDNLSQTIEGQETSTTKYPTTKAVVDYVGSSIDNLVDDVKIDGTSIVDENKVANIPLATSGGHWAGGTKGIATYRDAYGVTLASGNIVRLSLLENSMINSRFGSGGTAYQEYAVTLKRLDYAVKAALTDGQGADYTTAEQSAARTRFGAASETDLEDLSRRVDALHGFEIVFLTTGEYDPETGIPTILGPQEGTLYLVPSGQEAPDVWTEWLWTGEAWEKFGSSSIDLSNYVQKTDIATYKAPGIVLTNPDYGITTLNASNGTIGLSRANETNIDGRLSYPSSAYNKPITTENLDYAVKAALTDGVGPAYTEVEQAAAITRLGIQVPSISYDETEEMLVWQSTANDGNEVSY